MNYSYPDMNTNNSNDISSDNSTDNSTEILESLKTNFEEIKDQMMSWREKETDAFIKLNPGNFHDFCKKIKVAQQFLIELQSFLLTNR